MHRTPRIVFVYSGLGSYWPGMAADLLRNDAVFAGRFREAERALAERAGVPLLGVVEEKRAALSPGEEHALNFAYQLAMSARLRDWGIAPDYFAGHSAGEVAAAVDAGIVTLDEGARLVGAHRDVLDGWGERCGLAFVALPEGEALALVGALGGAAQDVAAAAVNDPGSVVLSGPPEQLDRCVARAAEAGVFARRLALFSPLHHPFLAPRLDAMRQALAPLRPKDPAIPVLSSWRGGLSRAGDFDAGYWVAHVGEKNRFGDAILSLSAGSPYVAIEIAPHPVLAESLSACFRAAGISGKILAVGRRNEPAHSVLQNMLRELRAGEKPAERGGRAPAHSEASLPKNRDELAEAICGIVRTLLDGRSCDIDADSGFLESGLDSMGLLRLKAELERRYDAELGVETFFHSPTPSRLAEKILGIDAITVSASPVSGRDDGIAVIGMACRLPGGVENPDDYWRLLLSGKDAIIPVPEDRWDRDSWYDTDPKYPGKTHTRAGGFLQRPVDTFDAEFFGMSSGEASALDPQQRLFLETAWEAVESAGIDPASLKGRRVGVFLGLSADDYAIIHRYADPRRLGGYSLTGSTGSTACGRVSFFFGLEGPSYVVDTACSSSLACLHLARRALLNGEIDMALAGGANIMLIPEIHVCFSKLGATSADGRCKTFDASANGYGRGEGAGMLALKRAAEARRDGDPVLVVVRGSAVNSDGRSSSLTAPNGSAQEAVAREALSQAGWRPEEVAYVETHGTGTPLGDAVEVSALGEVYGRARSAGTAPLRLGSAKPVIGHLEAAAGAASFIKVALAVGKGILPASIGCSEPNPAIDWDGMHVAVNREASPWPEGRRRAGISAFGIGGTNCHALLEDAGEDAAVRGDGEAGKTELLTLSARTPEALRELCARWAKAVSGGTAPLADIAHTSREGRTRFRRRAAATGKDGQALKEVLERLASSDATGRDAVPASAPAVVFLYPGQGAQRAGMGAALYRDYPVYRDAFDLAAAAFDGVLPVPLAEAVFGGSASDEALTKHVFAQSSLFASGIAATALWKSWGVVPAVVAGHSVGEYAAACAAGALRLEDAARLVAARALAMEALPPGGGMAAARMGAETARESFVRLGFPVLEVAAANAPESITVSGPLDALRAWGEAMNTEGVAVKPLAVSGAFHSAAVASVMTRLDGVGGKIVCGEPAVEWWSTRRAARMEGSDFAKYWAEQTRGCVRFMDTVRALRGAGNTLFVEMGPGTTLVGLGREGCPDAVFLPGMGAPGQERETALRSLGALWEKGVNPVPAGLNPDGRARRVAMLPTYPFQRRRHWDAEPRMFPGERVSGADAIAAVPAAEGQPYLGAALDGPGVEGNAWESVYTDVFPDFMPEHVIFGRAIAPAAAYVSLAISAGVERWGLPLDLADFEFNEPLIGEAGHPRRVRVVLGEDGEFGVFSKDAGKNADAGGGEWLRHARGKVRPLASGAGSIADAAPPSLAGDGVWEESHEELYRVFLDNQYALGDDFRKIRSARIGENVADCDVDCAPPEKVRGLKLIHPGRMDSIIQTGMPAIGAKRREYVEDGKILIPMRIDRLLVRSLPAGVVRSVGSVRHAGGATVHTLDVFGDAGAGIMRVEGMLLRQVNVASLYGDARRKPGLFAEEWVERDAPPANPDRVSGWIVAGGDAAETEAVAEMLRGAGAKSIRVADTEKGRAELAKTLLSLRGMETGGMRFVYVAAGPDGKDAAAARRIVGGAYAFAQSLAEAGLLERGRLWLLEKTDDDSFWAGALKGFGRSFRQEFPSAWGGRIETTSWRVPELYALLTAAEPPDGDDEWRLREGMPACAPRIAALSAPNRSSGSENSERIAARIRGGTHLVTGGAGALGRSFAAWLLRRGAARVVLCGRRGADAPDVAALLVELRSTADDGQTVEYRQCDVADADAVRSFVAGLSAGAEGMTLRGIFHAAGALEDGAVGEKSWDGVLAALGAKARGAWNLHEATAALPLEFFVLFSSASSLLGSAGQTAYASANAALDRLAQLRRRAGLPALAVQWGPWAGGGMAAGAGRGDRLRRFGMDGLLPDDALFGFEQALARGDAVLAVMHIDWKAYFGQWLGGTRPGRFGNVAPKDSGSAENAAGLPELLAAVPDGERPAALDAWLDGAARDLLGRHESLDPDQPLLEQGFDSLMAIEWRNHMAKALGRDVPSSFLFDYPTLRSVADSILPEVTREIAPEETAAGETESRAAGTRDILNELDELLGE